MKRIEVTTASEPIAPRHEADVDRVVAALRGAGFDATPAQAHALWKRFSAGYCAGWLSDSEMKDEDIVRCVRPFFRVLDESVSNLDVGRLCIEEERARRKCFETPPLHKDFPAAVAAWREADRARREALDGLLGPRGLTNADPTG